MQTIRRNTYTVQDKKEKQFTLSNSNNGKVISKSKNKELHLYCLVCMLLLLLFHCSWKWNKSKKGQIGWFKANVPFMFLLQTTEECGPQSYLIEHFFAENLY